jgi:hypothetical protein
MAGYVLGQDTTKVNLPPVPIKMTPQQKRAQLDAITAKRRVEIIRKKDSILDRNAAAGHTTREAIREQQSKQGESNWMTVDGLNIKENYKRGATKGSCSTGVANKGESLKDNR